MSQKGKNAIAGEVILIAFFCFIFAVFMLPYMEGTLKQQYLDSEEGKLETRLMLKQLAIKEIAQSTNFNGQGAEHDLKLRIKNMFMLNQAIQEKRLKVLKVIEGLEVDIISLKNELGKSDYSFQEAIRDSVTKGKLGLLQRKKAYVEQLTEVKEYLVSGINELDIKIDEAYTDLTMLEVLGQDKLSVLLSGIDKVLEKYTPFASDDIINHSKLKFRPLEEIWADMRNG